MFGAAAAAAGDDDDVAAGRGFPRGAAAAGSRRAVPDAAGTTVGAGVGGAAGSGGVVSCAMVGGDALAVPGVADATPDESDGDALAAREARARERVDTVKPTTTTTASSASPARTLRSHTRLGVVLGSSAGGDPKFTRVESPPATLGETGGTGRATAGIGSVLAPGARPRS